MTVVDVQPGAWCPHGVGAFHRPYANPTGSAAGVAAWLLNYLYPLEQWRDQLLGDRAAVTSAAADWESAARSLASTHTSYEQALRVTVELEGKSARALRRALEQGRDVATDAAEWTRSAAASLELAARVVSAVHDAVAGAIGELANLAMALFEFGLSLASLNPIDRWNKLSELIIAVDRYIDQITSLINDMFDVFEALVQLLATLGPVIDEATAALRELASRMVDAAGLPVGLIAGGAGGLLLGGVPGMLIGGALGGILGDTAGGVASDWLAADPEVREIDASDLADDDDQQKAYNTAMGCTELDSLTTFVEQNAYTDAMGKTDRTVVDIKKVVAADGSEHWVVSLPSTQDWNILKTTVGEGAWEDLLADYPATNDLDTNVALMLADHPEIAGQYQRGVYEAMRQAGIPAGAPVVYSGFSQGGIMSASLAADTHTPYDPIGIVTTGAPVDRFDIPADVRVVAFAHESDPVAAIDDVMDGAGRVLQGTGIATGSSLATAAGGALRQGHSDIATVTIDDPTVLTESRLADADIGEVPSVHSSPGYLQSVSEWEAANPEQAAEAVDLLGGTVVDHHTYAFEE